jgi:dihydrofolate reductase
MRKLSLFIACSLDGYIAGENDDLSFLKTVEKAGEDYGYGTFTADIDTIIIGSRTYDYVVKNIGEQHYDNGNNEVYVLTKTERQNHGKINFYSGAIADLIQNLRSKPGKNIYCDGGAEVIDSFLKAKLIDEIIISIIPVLLGNGIRLFKDGNTMQNLKLKQTKPYDTGLVQLHYKLER